MAIRILILHILLTLFLLPDNAVARQEFDCGVVKTILGATAFLLEDGRTVQLAGVNAPMTSIPHAPMNALPDEPLEKEARQALASSIEGKQVCLHNGIRDRHGRSVAQVYDTAGRWIQEAMVRNGWTRVDNCSGDVLHSAFLLDAERQARQEKRGIWNNAYYSIVTPEQADRHIGYFTLVQGVMREVKEIHGNSYFNFGDDWRTDFTVFIARKNRRRFKEELQQLEGKTIRVRGWMYRKNGPAIDIAHPEQIEIIE